MSSDLTQQDARDPLGRCRLSPLQLPAGVMRRELAGRSDPQAKVFLNAIERLPDNRLVVGIATSTRQRRTERIMRQLTDTKGRTWDVDLDKKQ